MSLDSVTESGGQWLPCAWACPCPRFPLMGLPRPLTGLPHLFMDLLVHPHDSIL